MVSPTARQIHKPASTEVRAVQGWIPKALFDPNSNISALFRKSLHNMPHVDPWLATLCVVCEGSGRCEALQINTSQMKSHSNGKMRKVKRHDTTN